MRVQYFKSHGWLEPMVRVRGECGHVWLLRGSGDYCALFERFWWCQ